MIHFKFKYVQTVLLMLIAFACGMLIKASSIPTIAVVNIEQVLENYPKFTAIKQDNENKLNELAQWIEKINAEIDEEKDLEKRHKLADQYRKLTYEKENFIKQEYGSKLQDINVEMTALIDKVAKQNGCSHVFANTSMVTGGKDITQNVIKELKENP